VSLQPLTLGTAGHIDHGKTRLVKALTGTDTDRLPAERERGISIELGYAQLELPTGRLLSVIDVPGHERFVRTMVAGATGIDLFLLVVDAAEGPRPQTHEHLRILRLLGIEHGVAAVTKLDACSPEQSEATVRAVRDLLPACEIVPLSAQTGEGLPALLAALDRAASTVERNAGFGSTRLYADRVFSLPGTGTVATGTLWSGAVTVGDQLQILPGDFEVRVRSVQVHGHAVGEAVAGQRVAVSLVKQRRHRIERGSALVQPGVYPASLRLDVALEEDMPIAHGARLSVCHGTSALPARVVRVGTRYAQLRLDRPVVAARGDRLVLRRETTLGGALVLDPDPPRHASEERMLLLDAATPRALLSGIVHAPVRTAWLEGRGLLDGKALREGLGALEQAGDWAFSPAWLAETRATARTALAARENELDPGLPASALLGQEAWSGAILPLLGLESSDGKFYLPGRRPETRVGSDEAAALDRELAAAGFEPVPVDDANLIRQLEREGRLVRLGHGFAIGGDAYGRAVALLKAECEREGSITLARFRDLLGTSRRVAQLLLERFDVDKVTIRIGETRRLRRSATRR
jgi:selenocysteine-specific elongation factor